MVKKEDLYVENKREVHVHVLNVKKQEHYGLNSATKRFTLFMISNIKFLSHDFCYYVARSAAQNVASQEFHLSAKITLLHYKLVREVIPYFF